MALTIDQILDGLMISRSEFQLVFLQAQIDTDQNGEDRATLEAVTNAAVDREAFRESLVWADQKGFLDSLVRIAVAESRETEALRGHWRAKPLNARQTRTEQPIYRRSPKWPRDSTAPRCFSAA